MRLSKTQVGAILWLLRQLGHQDAPSVKSFYAIQERVRQVAVLPTVQMFTPTGKVFCRNRIPDLIRMVSTNLFNSITCNYHVLTSHSVGLGKPGNPPTYRRVPDPFSVG